MIRAKLAETGQSVVASACSVDVGTVSRWISEGRFDQFCVALDAIGLKIVPAGAKCLKDADELDKLLWWARKGVESVKRAEDLVWDDEEIPLEVRESGSAYAVVQIS